MLSRVSVVANADPAGLPLLVEAAGSGLTLEAWEQDLRAGRAAGDATLPAIQTLVVVG